MHMMRTLKWAYRWEYWSPQDYKDITERPGNIEREKPHDTFGCYLRVAW